MKWVEKYWERKDNSGSVRSYKSIARFVGFFSKQALVFFLIFFFLFHLGFCLFECIVGRSWRKEGGQAVVAFNFCKPKKKIKEVQGWVLKTKHVALCFTFHGMSFFLGFFYYVGFGNHSARSYGREWESYTSNFETPSWSSKGIGIGI